MWTIVRFALQRGSDYRAAFDLLAPAGFRIHRGPEGGALETFPAAVVADVLQEPSVITRAVFDGLDGAGLRPIGVAASHVVLGAARVQRPLARA